MAPHMRTVAAGALLDATVLSACSFSNPEVGPLGHPFQGGIECLALAGHQVVTYGLEWVRNPGTATAVSAPIGHADVAFTMKQYVQTDLQADRQVASTLAELIIGGSLVSVDLRMNQASDGTGTAA
jgi:hypothetical protein